MTAWLGYRHPAVYLKAYATPAGRAGMMRRINRRLAEWRATKGDANE